MRTIVTASDTGADIDVLGCAVGYAELLRLEGKNAVAVITGKFTASVTPSLLGLGAQYETTYKPLSDDQFVLVDISSPEHFAKFVDHARILEVYDHRFHGNETMWKEKLGEGCHIEAVGACATLVAEQAKLRGHLADLSIASKKLIMAAIVSNTLNFKARVTTERDRMLYAELMQMTDTPEDWVGKYFEEQEVELLKNPEELVRSDTKIQSLRDGTVTIGQTELWDARAFLDAEKSAIERILVSFGNDEWFSTLPSISEGKNYLFTRSGKAQKRLEKALGVTFNGDTATTDTLFMRKEIMALLLKDSRPSNILGN